MSDCREFESLLEGWVAGTLDRTARRAAEAHLAGCPDCRELVELARLPDDGAELTATVLAATSGAACARTEESLPAYLEAGPSGLDRQLVALHLETCPACRRLASILTAMEHALPRLAELRVPATFTRDVLATLGALRHSSPSPTPVPAEPIGARLARGWRAAWPRLIRRPRFATELAYALTVVGILIVQMTGAFADTEPRELLGRARAQTVEQVQALAEAPMVNGTAATAQRLSDRFERFLRALHGSTGTFLREAASSLQNPDAADASAATKETP